MADLSKHSGAATWVATKPLPWVRLRYHASYDYDSAQLDEWYTLEEKYLTLFWHREKWRTMGSRHPDYGKLDYRGDIKWAKKLAKDLSIDLPEPTHRLSAWRPKTRRPK